MKDWKNFYSLPLKADDFFMYITDKKDNIVAQFILGDVEKCKQIIDVINGKNTFKNNDLHFRHDGGLILANDLEILLIRGWGNLTGIGGHNLSSDEAAHVQDTFAEYIVEKLNLRDTK